MLAAFCLEHFLEAPSIELINSCRKCDLLQIVGHLKLTGPFPWRCKPLVLRQPIVCVDCHIYMQEGWHGFPASQSSVGVVMLEFTWRKAGSLKRPGAVAKTITTLLIPWCLILHHEIETLFLANSHTWSNCFAWHKLLQKMHFYDFSSSNVLEKQKFW